MKKIIIVFIMMFAVMQTAQAQESMIAEVKLFAGNFAPRGWAFCQGQILQISQNQALFSLLGTTYGGDGRNTFALPDLRGSVPVGTGNSDRFGDTKLGNKGQITNGAEKKNTGTLGMNYIICIQGIFPSRS